MKNNEIRSFVVEILIPIIIFVQVMPLLAGPIWQNVEADPSTTWYDLAAMHFISILIGVCWLQCYNYLRIGLFPPKR